MNVKTNKKLIEDLKSHNRLLTASCTRFVNEMNFDEIKNIGVRLRVLIGSGNGSGIFIDLAKKYQYTPEILILNQNGIISLTEIDNDTGKVLQQKEKKAIINQAFDRLPLSLPISNVTGLYIKVPLFEWIQNGFLIDWEVPTKSGDTKIKRFTPQLLINRYAGQEAAHSDSSYGSFGNSLESLAYDITKDAQTISIPLVYKFLFDIGLTVSSCINSFLELNNVVNGE